MVKKIRGVALEENLNNSMGLEFYNLSHRFGYQSPNWPYFEDVKIERIHYMAKSGVLSQRITTSMHNTTHIDAPAHVVQGTAVHRRGAAAAFLRLRHRGVDPEEEMGADHLRRSGKGGRQDRAAARRGDRQHRLAQALRGQRGLFLPRAGLRAVGGRMVRREEGQGHRPRHPGQRPSARHRDRPAAQRAAASAPRRRIQEMVGRARLEGRFPRLGAGAPHPVQERHSGHRERRRRHRQGHRPALHLRAVSRGTGSAATAASSGSLRSSIRKGLTGSRKGRSSA